MMKKFIFTTAVAALLATTAFGAGFAKTNTYTPGQFADVSEELWYASSVSAAYELGFMKGSTDSTFEPEGNMTVAEAITIASRVNDAYSSKGTTFDQSTGSNWYDCYVKYATDNGIITADRFDNYDRNITRAEMAVVFSKAVPADYLNAQNNVKEIPDMPSTNKGYNEVLSLYKAGVVMGNDEFGTFKPNNNIIRAEAAAIIGRVALPENRLKKELTDANYGDAYYLVHEGGRGISDGQVYNESPWNYDNRGRFADISNASKNIKDSSKEHKVELWRDVDDVTDGLVGWDFIGSISAASEGKYFKLTDDNGNTVVALETKNNKLIFNGVDTGKDVPAGTFQFTIKADLDANKASFYLNGETIAEDTVAGDYTVSRVYIGSDKESTGNITISRTDIYKDYLVNDIFAQPKDKPLCKWNVTGEAVSVQLNGQNYQDLVSAQLKGKSTASQNFNKISGDVVFEALMLFPEKTDTGYMALTSAGTPVATMKLNADGVFKADGTKLRFHNNNIWQTLRIELDTVNATVTYKVNGKVVAENVTMDAYANFVDGIVFGSESGNVYFDDVKVYLTHEYDDYCPAPVPVTDDGYDVILNMCSLWREGFHSNWGAISAYPDIEPALGYYDEGLTEVADWEIKFMVENGIDVQHLCWYCGQSDINTPMKKTNHNDALHGGFFNAKYSDMMKFTFMWENSGVNCKSLEQFKEYIWKYWMDYYFLDDRFYTIDNKIVFTVWSKANFKTAFGGSYAGCEEAVAWMNEDAKAHGFDGVLIFFADGHATDAASFKDMASMGGDAAYAYHWQQDGIKASTTLPRLQKNQDYNEIHVIPTVSVGFNNVGWSAVRKPLASLEDHKKVLEYIKNDYLPKAESGWKQNTLIVSTWNEYGEGTYVMPTPELHGFGYLENIAEVISGDTEHRNNIYPTEQQKARLGHLYPDSKTSMRRLDYEKDEEAAAVPTKVIASFEGEDFEINMNTEKIEYVDGVAVATSSKTDTALDIKDAAVAAKGDINMDEVVAIKITACGTAKADSVYFCSKEDPSIAQKKCYDIEWKGEPSDEFEDIIIYTNTNEYWTGTFKNFRLDIIIGPGTYKLKKIEFLGYDDSQKPYGIKVDTVDYKPYLAPVERNNDVYVITEAYNGFFSLHNFYYEWSRKTGVLKIVSKNDTEVVMTVGSDVALVNGKAEKLAEPLKTKDGIPEVPLFWLYKATDTTYTVEGRTIEAFTADDKYIEVLKNRKAGEWEFNIPGDPEGFTAADGTIDVMDGLFKGESIRRNNQSNPYDARYTITGLALDTKKYNKIVVRMAVNTEEETGMGMYFITTNESNWNQAKCVEAKIDMANNGKFVEYELRMGENDKWNGNITGLRFDPIGRAGSYEIDYIRCVYDSSIRYDNGLPMAEELVNGDAEDKAVTFYGSTAVKISIVKDAEKGNVYLAKGQTEKAWLYVRQNVNWEAGAEYKVSADIKFTETFSGKTDAKTKIYCNVVYEDADGKRDHTIQLADMSPEDGWKHVDFTIKIPAKINNGDNGQFTFYTNPAGEETMSYMFDNVVIEKVGGGSSANAAAPKTEVNGVPYPQDLVNGDAEESNVAFFGSAAAKISIEKDAEKGNVYLVDGQTEKAWLYSRQKVYWEAGATYLVTADIKFTKTFSGKTNEKTSILTNAVYTDKDGKQDHVISVATLAPEDGWKHVEYEVAIPADIKDGNGQFTFYTNPAGEETMSYMFDNVVITRVG